MLHSIERKQPFDYALNAFVNTLFHYALDQLFVQTIFVFFDLSYEPW